MQKVLSIAGSDCSGGAGIQADIKTITAHKLYAMSVVTALTAQNTLGVEAVMEIPAEFIAKQLDSVFEDIVPDSVKIGMTSCQDVIAVIADKLTAYGAKHIVVDPVMVSTSGCRLISEHAIDTLKQKLLPLAEIITPNIPEAEVLSGINIKDERDMIAAGKLLCQRYGCAVLVKGGHRSDNATDIFCQNGEVVRFCAERIDNPNTHGTGCTLSSAIASNLAMGISLAESVQNAKAYLLGALKAGLNLGKGAGPLDHGYKITL